MLTHQSAVGTDKGSKNIVVNRVGFYLQKVIHS